VGSQSSGKEQRTEKFLAQTGAWGDAEGEQFCTGRPDEMIGIVKKIDVQGFGIIDGADGSKVPFIQSDVMNRHLLEPGQKVMFSVRRVKDQPFAEHVIVMDQNWSGG
jgi:cold shock CspA family protein